MRKEGETHSSEDKKLENKWELLKHLVQVAGDANYPVEVRRGAFQIHSDLENSGLDLDLGKIGALIVNMRKILIASGKGDSEFAKTLEKLHQNLK